MNKRILIRPIVTEKSTKQSDKLNKYTFKVDRHVNKLEIKQAVQDMYNVTVLEVNTLIVPAKIKSTVRDGKAVPGRKAGYKKAIVTVQPGEFINVFGNANAAEE